MKNLKIKKKRLIGFLVKLKVDDRVFNITLSNQQKEVLKDLLKKNQLKGYQVSYEEIFD